MSKGTFLGCCSADQFTVVVTLLSTIIISGLAGPRLSLEHSDVMEHTYFGGQMRGETLSLEACNPDFDPHFRNCVMTLTDAEVAIKATSPLAREALDQLASQHHVTSSSVHFRPRDVKLWNSALISYQQRNQTQQSDMQDGEDSIRLSFAW